MRGHWVLVVVLALPLVSGQEVIGSPLCAEATPCTWVIRLGAEGFVSNHTDDYVAFPQDGWVQIVAVNNGTVSRNVTNEAMGLHIALEPRGVNFTAPFRLPPVGGYAILDDFTGDILPLLVAPYQGTDVSTPWDQASEPPAESTPGGGGILGLAVAALAARRFS